MDLSADGRDTIGFGRLPESVTSQIAEWQVGVVLIVVFPNEIETLCKSVTKFLAPWNVIRGGQPGVDKIEGGQQQQGLMRPLVGTPLINRRDADVEVVEAFDGRIDMHKRREGIDLLEWKEKDQISACRKGWDNGRVTHQKLKT